MAADSLYSDVKKRTGWAIFMGLLMAALGVLLIIYPMVTAELTSVVLGWALIFVGLAQFAFALYSQGIGQFFLRILLSVLFGLTGIALAFFPAPGVAALTVMLGSLLTAQGILQAVVAFKARPMEGWGWLLADAAVSLVLGILVLAQWPSSSIWAIGTLVGVSVLMSGIARIRIAATIRSGASNVARAVRGTA
jgi:uncharacterized membrane protein HdeD (DUF308 family)